MPVVHSLVDGLPRPLWNASNCQQSGNCDVCNLCGSLVDLTSVSVFNPPRRFLDGCSRIGLRCVFECFVDVCHRLVCTVPLGFCGQYSNCDASAMPARIVGVFRFGEVQRACCPQHGSGRFAKTNVYPDFKGIDPSAFDCNPVGRCCCGRETSEGIGARMLGICREGLCSSAPFERQP